MVAEPLNMLFLNGEDFLHVQDRKGELMGALLGEQNTHHRQRQRQLHTNRRPLLRDTLDGNAPLYMTDGSLDYIHTDTASRQHGHLVSRRKSRRKDKLDDLL